MLAVVSMAKPIVLILIPPSLRCEQEEEEVHIANLLILKAQKDQEAADEAVAAIQSQKEYLDELDEQEKLGIVDEPVDVSH